MSSNLPSRANPEGVARLSYTLDELVAATGIARTRVYEAIAAGSLRSFKLGRRRMISADAAREFLARAETGGAR